MNKFDDLTAFTQWWLATKALCPPVDTPLIFDNAIYGVVLYRDGPYQVQLFLSAPNSVINPHIHPNCDSYELYFSGDLSFTIDGITKVSSGEPFLGVYSQPSRVLPNSWHEGAAGEKGVCFLSFQKWLNGVKPTSVGKDWHDNDGNTQGKATIKQDT